MEKQNKTKTKGKGIEFPINRAYLDSLLTHNVKYRAFKINSRMRLSFSIKYEATATNNISS